MKTALAQVVRVLDVTPHPNADNLDVLKVGTCTSCNKHDITDTITLVTGKHYEVGQLGVWIRPRVKIPGWLAMDLWLVGKQQALEWFEVSKRPIRGIDSAGLFAGQRFRNSPFDDWQDWKPWQRSWQIGTDVTAYLGVKR